mmetsp:Transcript_33160/g.130538  ORF Transcript_33160/g.130538 Transcript_33160/m.130538 type:complete len:172 (-) Transcript_33160:2665-3180(-)
MFETVKTLEVPYVLMHTRGNPSNMMSLATYRRDEALFSQVATELRENIHDAMESGIPRWDIIVDPGFGFAKDSGHNVELLKTLDLFKDELRDFPVLTGTSRKAFIGKILNDALPKDRDFGTAAAVTLCAALGSNIVRFHNPRVADAVSVTEEVLKNQKVVLAPLKGAPGSN